MTVIGVDGLYDDRLYRIRYMRSILEQIREDHRELQRLCNNLKNGPMDKYHEEESLRLITWLKDGLNLFKGLMQRGIEGVCWGEIEDIERDIQNKERTLGLNADYPMERPPLSL